MAPHVVTYQAATYPIVPPGSGRSATGWPRRSWRGPAAAGSSTVNDVPGVRTLRVLPLVLGWSRRRRPALAWLETITSGPAGLEAAWEPDAPPGAAPLPARGYCRPPQPGSHKPAGAIPVAHVEPLVDLADLLGMAWSGRFEHAQYRPAERMARILEFSPAGRASAGLPPQRWVTRARSARWAQGLGPGMELERGWNGAARGGLGAGGRVREEQATTGSTLPHTRPPHSRSTRPGR